MESPPITSEEILFGHDPTERIVAVEPGERAVTYWRRLEDDTVVQESESFRPWILLTEPTDLINHPPRLLEGDGFRYLYEFTSWRDYQNSVALIRDRHLEMLTYGNGAKLALLRSGKTLFKGMALPDVRRMQVDIETETLGAGHQASRILIIAVRDSAGLLELIHGDEKEILHRFVALVKERDPDVLEGHNLLGFDIPYLMARATVHRIRLALGRDGSEPRQGRERNFAIGGINRPFAPIWIYGRQVFDTFLAVQRFDWAAGRLTSYGLKAIAQAFGIAEPGREELPRAEIGRIFREDPQRVLDYCRADVLETARLSDLVAPVEFYTTQMVPDSFGSSAVTGTGERINSILVRAYLRAGRAIPRPRPSRAVAGGYTDIRATGIVQRVVKADFESLYPSIMLAEGIKPKSDILNVFEPALRELTRRRLEAKSKMAEAAAALSSNESLSSLTSQMSPQSQVYYWDGLQSSFKVLINSFYGYLGAVPFHFNDCDAADQITARGRALVQQVADRMEQSGSRVIEIDTDGVYFTPPESIQGEQAEREYVARMGEGLPLGIRLAFDGRYKAIVSLKTKNYVLQGYDGKLTFRGASLRSRADEPYGREFLAAAIDLLLANRIYEVSALYRTTIDSILDRKIPIEKLARRERVTEKTFISAQKARSAAAAADSPIGEYITVYEREGGTLCLYEEYEEGTENCVYYAEKLYRFACRLEEAFGDQFALLIPSPRKIMAENPYQQTLDLFG